MENSRTFFGGMFGGFFGIGIVGGASLIAVRFLADQLNLTQFFNTHPYIGFLCVIFIGVIGISVGMIFGVAIGKRYISRILP